jgi:hypothetical protein
MQKWIIKILMQQVKVGGQMQQHKKWYIEILMLNVKL